MKKDNISIMGFDGTWYIIDEVVKNKVKYFLLENEEYGDGVGCLIVDEDYNVVIENVFNGLEELNY